MLTMFSNCSTKIGLLSQKALKNYNNLDNNIINNHIFNLSFHRTPLPIIE